MLITCAAYSSNNGWLDMNGADALCDTLLSGGVDVCFANPGTSEMHFVAALNDQAADALHPRFV